MIPDAWFLACQKAQKRSYPVSLCRWKAAWTYTGEVSEPRPLRAHPAVDFRKGCYLGQELTVRTYHTGATRKRILPITLQSSSLPSGHLAEPSEIFYQPPPSAASQKVRSAGKILALHDKVGLGLVRVEMAEKSCWVDGGDQDRGSLFINVDGKNVQIAVNRGEAYAAASI